MPALAVYATRAPFYRAEQLASSACEHCREHRHESPSPTLASGPSESIRIARGALLIPPLSPLDADYRATDAPRKRLTPSQMRNDDECVRILASDSSPLVRSETDRRARFLSQSCEQQRIESIPRRQSAEGLRKQRPNRKLAPDDG